MKNAITLLTVVMFNFSLHSMAQPLPRTAAGLPVYFETNFNAGNIDALMKLYVPASILMPEPGKVVKGAAIKESLLQFMGLNIPMRTTVRHLYEADGVALVIADWTIDGTGPDGKEIHLKGTTTDVMKRQKDGTWRYIIDNPFGTFNPAAESSK